MGPYRFSEAILLKATISSFKLSKNRSFRWIFIRKTFKLCRLNLTFRYVPTEHVQPTKVTCSLTSRYPTLYGKNWRSILPFSVKNWNLFRFLRQYFWKVSGFQRMPSSGNQDQTFLYRPPNAILYFSYWSKQFINFFPRESVIHG